MANLRELIGPRAARVLETIPDLAERKRALSAVEVCGGALGVVDALDLTPHELSEEESSDLGAWNALAPEVRNLMLTVRDAAERLRSLYPFQPPAPGSTGTLDVDAAFSELEFGHTPVPIRDRREQDIDDIIGLLTGDLTADVASAIHSLASMLEADFIGFGQRLRNPKMTADRWHLLGELQELQTKCGQCLEAVLAAVLGAYTSQELETVLPRYQNQAARAVRLRTAIVDLAYDVEALNGDLQAAGAEEAQVVGAKLVRRLNALAESPAYRLFRPADKREVIKFRLKLKGLAELGVEALRQAVEGFAKFAEVLRSINQREVLGQHDRDRLQTLEMLIDSEADLMALGPHLEAVYGRSLALDATIRQLRHGEVIALEGLLPLIQEARAQLRGGF